MADGPEEEDNVVKLEPGFKLDTEQRAWLHDQFAKAALPALILGRGVLFEQIPAKAYEIADAMMAERAKRN